MDYTKIYNQIIERSKTEVRNRGCGVYYEAHHIIPRCLGGSNDKSNISLLTAKEHRVAHACLHMMNPSHPGLALAYIKMCYGNKWQDRKGYIPLKLYNDARLLASEVARDFRKGKTYEDIMGTELALARRQLHSSKMTGRKWTEEQKIKAQKPKPDGFGAKISKAHTGRVFSSSTLTKMRLKAKSVEQVDKTGQVVRVWPSIRQAAKEYNVPSYNITLCCRKPHKTLVGFYWRYVK